MTDGQVVKMKKACKCFATSSGPRVLVKEGPHPRYTPSDDFVATVTLTMMACDSCNKPWVAA